MHTGIEELMSKYKSNYRRIQELETLIAQYTITKDDVIQEKVFSRSGGERVQTSNVTDRTASVAETADKTLEKYDEELISKRTAFEMEKKKLEKENMLLEKSLDALNDNIRDFAKDLVRGMKWDSLELKYHVSRATIGNWRRRVVCELEVQYNKAEQDLMRRLMR